MFYETELNAILALIEGNDKLHFSRILSASQCAHCFYDRTVEG